MNVATLGFASHKRCGSIIDPQHAMDCGEQFRRGGC